jgi:prophage antirepressor-like protein
MNDLLCFDFNEQAVRVILIDAAPWWVAADICAILGLGNVTMAIRKLDNDQITLNQIEGASNGKPVNLVSESGLWTLVLRSDKPQAVAIRRWLTGEVLPALRRTGRYAMPGADQLDDEAPAAGMDLSRVTVALNLVREARKLFGVRSAQRIWLDAGLPAPCPSEAPALFADALAGEVRAFLATVAECTLDQLMAALGLPLADNGLRLRCGRILRALGWFPWKVRRDGRPVNLFAPRTMSSVEA